jgi:threonine dehydratase
MAGQGTIGLEIVEQCEGADAVVVPVGGGGLIAGIATAIKTLSPNTKIIVSNF